MQQQQLSKPVCGCLQLLQSNAHHAALLCFAGYSFGPFGMPVALAGGLRFRSITCGGFHTCALDGEGQAWCLGL